MRTLIIATLLAIGGTAWADTAVVKVYSLDVMERIQTLELINVTAEKTVSADAEAPDADLQTILDDAEALEDEE